MKYLFIVISCLCFTSCAILLNDKRTDVYLYSIKPIKVIHNSDSIVADSTQRAHLFVLRSDKALKIELSKDSILKDISIRPKTSPTYFANLFCYYGFLFDLLSPRRYKYPNKLYLDDNLLISEKPSDNEKQRFKKLKNRLYPDPYAKYLPKKGNLLMNISFPFAFPSHSYLRPGRNKTTSSGSFWGFGVGFDYYYRDNRFINLSSSCTFGGDFWFGYDADHYHDQTRFDLYNITLSHNHRLDRFTFGYGISYMFNDWWRNDYEPKDLLDEHGYVIDPNFPPTRHHIGWRYSTLGLTLNSYYRIFKTLNLGITYRPQLFRLSANTSNWFRYEHQISLDIAFKFKLSK